MIRGLPLCLMACTPSAWTLSLEPAPDAVLEDGCEVQWDRWITVLQDRRLAEGADRTTEGATRPLAIDLAADPPVRADPQAVAPGIWDRLELVQGRVLGETVAGNLGAAELAAVTSTEATFLLSGSLVCGDRAASFTWAPVETVAIACPLPPLMLAAGGRLDVSLEVDRTRIFRSTIDDPEGSYQGLPLLDADRDLDQDITWEELEATPTAALGFDRGGAVALDTLALWVRAQLTWSAAAVGQPGCLPSVAPEEPPSD